VERYRGEIQRSAGMEGRFLAKPSLPDTLQDIVPLQTKVHSVSWEFMFRRSMFETKDMQAQLDLLHRLADLLGTGALKSTVYKKCGELTVDNLRTAHEFQETGKAIGKTALRGLHQ
ncbi:MAG: NADPH2:quinone reductase, partial [Planctomycetota bacterium]|jgi:NADPH2:quinone reductase